MAQTVGSLCSLGWFGLSCECVPEPMFFFIGPKVYRSENVETTFWFYFFLYLVVKQEKKAHSFSSKSIATYRLVLKRLGEWLLPKWWNKNRNKKTSILT